MVTHLSQDSINHSIASVIQKYSDFSTSVPDMYLTILQVLMLAGYGVNSNVASELSTMGAKLNAINIVFC